MKHKNLGNFLYEWFIVFDKLSLNSFRDANVNDINISILYNNRPIQFFKYNKLFYGNYDDDMFFIKELFPDLKIRYV